MDVRFAIDIGASSGRHIVGRTEGGELKTEEIYRFPNGVTKRDGHLIWDLEALLDHGKACIRISSYLAEELWQPCVMNIWTGDGFKDVPADRMGPRLRYKESIDEILSECYDFDKVKPCIESKVFGIGVEAYTAGSGEIALHVTRPIRWDSDHVVRFDDETREIAKEIVRCGGLEGRVHIALDCFDASINRISAWAAGCRNLQKALLFALLQPNAALKKLQDEGDFSRLMAAQEELKTLPFGKVWDEYCRRCGRPADGEWYPEIERYEREVLAQR